MSLEENLNQEQEDPQEPQDPQQPEDPTPPTNEPDFKTLYLDSLRERERLLLAQPPAPTLEVAPPQEESAPTLEEFQADPLNAIDRLLDRRLKAQLGDVTTMSAEYKMQRAVSDAENKVFQASPHLIQFKDQLAPQVRQLLIESGYAPTPQNYRNTMLAVIGNYTLQAALNGGGTPPANTPPSTPVPNNQPPTNRPKVPTPNNTPKVNETEKSEMRKLKMDPSKPEDILRWKSLIGEDAFVVG